MSQFFGVFRHEFGMSIRRPGLWITYGLLFAFYTAALLLPSADSPVERLADDQVMAEAAQMVFRFNLFMPLVGGILAADRMQRDFKLGVRELQTSAPLSRLVYILAKYAGVLASMLVPVLFWLIAEDALAVLTGQVPFSYVGASLLAFLAITVPAYAFVVPFSLACPLVMPLRVYQVLFTGYWFWGNFLSPKAFPTISDTLLTPSGMYAMQGFFHTSVVAGESIYTATQAWLNLLVLALCVAAVIVTLERYFAWQARRA